MLISVEYGSIVQVRQGLQRTLFEPHLRRLLLREATTLSELLLNPTSQLLFLQAIDLLQADHLPGDMLSEGEAL